MPELFVATTSQPRSDCSRSLPSWISRRGLRGILRRTEWCIRGRVSPDSLHGDYPSVHMPEQELAGRSPNYLSRTLFGIGHGDAGRCVHDLVARRVTRTSDCSSRG